MIRQAILFDFAGTLAFETPGRFGRLATALRESAIPFDPRLLRASFRRGERFRLDLLAQGEYIFSSLQTALEYTHHVFASLDRFPDTTQLLEIFRVYENIPRAYRLYPEVKAVLASLQSAGFRIGIVSNSDEPRERALTSLGIERYFDVVISSCSVGVAKPDAAIFRRATDELAIDPRYTLYVGDDPMIDGAGAEAAGLAPVILDRSGQLPGLSWPKVHSLEDIRALMHHSSTPNKITCSANAGSSGGK